MPGWVADSHGTHHFAMGQGIDLTGVAGDARASKGIMRKGNRLHLPICADMKGVSPTERTGGKKTRAALVVQTRAAFSTTELTPTHKPRVALGSILKTLLVLVGKDPQIIFTYRLSLWQLPHSGSQVTSHPTPILIK